MGFFDSLLKTINDALPNTTRMDKLAKDFKWYNVKNAHISELERAVKQVSQQYYLENGSIDFNPYSNTTKQMLVLVTAIANRESTDRLHDILKTNVSGSNTSEVCYAIYQYLKAPTSLTEHQTEEGKDLANTIEKLDMKNLLFRL